MNTENKWFIVMQNNKSGKAYTLHAVEYIIYKSKVVTSVKLWM